MSEGKATSPRLEIGIAGALIAFGGALAVAARRLPAGAEANVPGPGAAPGMLGLVLVACGLTVAVSAWRNLRAADLGDTRDDGVAKALLAVALVGGAILALEPLGFLLTSVLFLSAGFIWLGHAQWTVALPAAALASSGLWLFFTKLLGVGLPYGLIAEILFR